MEGTVPHPLPLSETGFFTLPSKANHGAEVPGDARQRATVTALPWCLVRVKCQCPVRLVPVLGGLTPTLGLTWRGLAETLTAS